MQRQKQTASGRQMANDIPSKWNPETSTSSDNHIQQSRPQAKINQGDKEEGHYILVKGTTHWEDVTIVNMICIYIERDR
jgi:hypothetical protein